MRRTFADALHSEMDFNKNIWLLTGDLGFGVFDDLRKVHKERFINCGASEQAMVGMGVGLALENQIPFVYSITPFLLYRPFETIRNYINHEKIPVRLVASGRDKEYLKDGISHWAEEEEQVLKIFSNIKVYTPQTAQEIHQMVKEMIDLPNPSYLSLSRFRGTE